MRSREGKRSTLPHEGARTTIAPEDPLSLHLETRLNQAELKDPESRQEAHRAAAGSGSLKRICLGQRQRLTAHQTRSNRAQDCRRSRARGQLPKDLRKRAEAGPVERRYCPASRFEHGVGQAGNGRMNIQNFNLHNESRRETFPLPSRSPTRYHLERSSQ